MLDAESSVWFLVEKPLLYAHNTALPPEAIVVRFDQTPHTKPNMACTWYVSEGGD